MTPSTSATYPGDGQTAAFAVPFLYVNRSDIRVYVGGVQTYSYTFNSAGQVVVTPTPAAGVPVLISRSTVADTSGFNFQSGALRAADINNAMRQCLYIAQEVLSTSLRANILGNWDAQGLPVTDAADPVNPQDLVTLNYLLEYVSKAIVATGQGGIPKSLFFTMMERVTAGSVATLTSQVPADPSDPTNIDFHFNPYVASTTPTYALAATVMPTGIAQVAQLAGLTS